VGGLVGGGGAEADDGESDAVVVGGGEPVEGDVEAGAVEAGGGGGGEVAGVPGEGATGGDVGPAEGLVGALVNVLVGRGGGAEDWWYASVNGRGEGEESKGSHDGGDSSPCPRLVIWPPFDVGVDGDVKDNRIGFGSHLT
jgi:hypothetical protein